MSIWRCVLGTGLALIAAGLAGGVEAGDYHAPRTAQGAPDLDGLWNNSSYTKLQRPKTLTGLVVTPEQARVFEARMVKYRGAAADTVEDEIGQQDAEFPDSGVALARIRGQIRTSWIVAPADGRIPYTPDAKMRLRIGTPDPPETYDNPEARPAFERCTTSAGSSPPLLSAQDANLFQFVQTPDHIAVLSEKNHDVRIISLKGGRDPRAPLSWSGDSIGHWEGETLVVETQGFRDPLVDRNFFAHSDQARIVERFTRTGPTEMLYAFAITDPKTFTMTWRAEMVFTAGKGPMYEYACHEGNYAIVNILRAAQLGRQISPVSQPAATQTAAR